MIKQLTIFGVGLIGGSLAMALRRANACERVVGCSRSAEHLQLAIDLDVIDEFTLDPKQAVSNADVVLLAVPMGAMETVLTQIAKELPAAAIVTQVDDEEVCATTPSSELEAYASEYEGYTGNEGETGK